MTLFKIKKGVKKMRNKLEGIEKLYREKILSNFEYNNLVCLNNITGYSIYIDKRVVNIEGKLENIKSSIELLALKEI